MTVYYKIRSILYKIEDDTIWWWNGTSLAPKGWTTGTHVQSDYDEVLDTGTKISESDVFLYILEHS